MKHEILWNIPFGSCGHSPILHEGHIHRFKQARRGAKGDTFAIADGKLTSGVLFRKNGLRDSSPILAGTYFVGFNAQGSRNRTDGKNLAAVHVLQRTGSTAAKTVSQKNLLDETAPPPDPRLQAHAPDVYDLKCWGKCGGIPEHFGYGSPFAQGNRLVFRSLSHLICVGDPAQSYDGVKK